MEQNAASNEALRRATHHLQQLLLRTPGKSSQTAASEAEAIAHLAFVEGNPVRELFVTSIPRKDQERPRSPSPCGTIRPKSSKAFFKFGRGRDKLTTVAGASSAAKQGTIDGVSPLFDNFFGPLQDEKRSKRKERVSDATPPTSSTGTSRGVPATSSSSSSSLQQKPPRQYEQYRCIVCDAELSSKGVCKRHLEEQHITPKVYECEGCHAYFDAKPEAKKHCGQCSEGDVSWIITKLPKKVYACEYTGSYFSGQRLYTEHLLSLSEQKGTRLRPNLNLKLEAILKYADNRTGAPLCGRISQSLFGSPDAWRELQWDQDYLQAKITILEHATFNPDGTMESIRWTGSALKRRNTEAYLTQLFQAGRLSMKSPHVNSGEMSMCWTRMPFTQNEAPSVASGPSTASPMPRSQSRQTTWSHDGMDHSTTTTASTPRSGDDVMTAELKSKRHLSDESRAYIPARTPPGPPDPPDHYQYTSDPAMLGSAPQLPPLPAFMTPSNSTISLPLRKQEGSGFPSTQTMVPASRYYPQYHTNLAHPTHNLTSDAASETSTLATSYREPELSGSIPIDYSLWSQQQLGYPAYAYNNNNNNNNNIDYSMPDDASMVASSINTGNTIGVEYISEIPKMESYSDMDISNHTHPGTFYLHDGGEAHHEDRMR